MGGDGRGRRASSPPLNYSRPRIFDKESLTVTRAVPSGAHETYNFSDLGSPTPFLLELIEAFVQCMSPTGRWDSKHSVQNGFYKLRSFYRYSQELDTPIHQASDFAPEAWETWRALRIKTSQAGTGVKVLRVILRKVQTLPEETQVALRAPVPHVRRRKKKASLAPQEFKRLVTRCWRIFDASWLRITANVRKYKELEAAIEANHATESEAAEFAIMKALLTDAHALGKSLPHYLRPARGEYGASSFYMSSLEAFAAMLLFAAERGYTPGMVYGLSIEHERPDGGEGVIAIKSLRTHKPRRGAKNAVAWDNLIDSGRHSLGNLYARLIETTTPARRFLALHGMVTQELFISYSRRGDFVPEKSFITGRRIRMAVRNLPERPAWLTTKCPREGNVLITMPIVRRTEQVLKRKPRFNSEEVHETVYVLPDDSIIPESTEVIVKGQLDAVKHARATMRLRVLTTDDLNRFEEDPRAFADSLGMPIGQIELLLSGRQDTAVASCIDFNASPHNPGPCRASFLLCLACRNAIVAPRHLPRLVTLNRALESIASAISPQVWREDYQAHYERLQHLLSTHFTEDEALVAVSRVSPADVAEIEALLMRRLDAR